MAPPPALPNDAPKVTAADALKKGKFDKETNFDNMAGNLIEQGAHPLIHGSMTDDQTPESLRKLYDGFADEYDGAYDAMDYVSPRAVAEKVVEVLTPPVAKAARILDAGCGTGKIGTPLREQVGPAAFILGIDISPKMMEKARARKAYNELGEANLMQPLGMEDNAFDATVSTGVFTGGHVKKEALLELARVTRPGGFLVIGCQELVFEKEGYVDYLEQLKSKGIAQLDDICRSFTMKKAGTEMNILVIRVL